MLEHVFLAVIRPVRKDILYSEEVYEYINQGQIETIDAIRIPDEIVQKIMYDACGNLLLEIDFNYWGISVYQKNDLRRWMILLKDKSELIRKELFDYYDRLYSFFESAYCKDNIIVHLGI